MIKYTYKDCGKPMIKVEHTKTITTYEDGIVKTIALVTDAKLVLVDIPKGKMCKIIFADGEGNHMMVAPNDDAFIFFKDHEQVIQPINPILISETEKIEVGQVWDGFEKRIAFVDNVKKYEPYNHLCKILTLPEHFSPEQLQMIVDGKLKDGDKVLVECEDKLIEPHKDQYGDLRENKFKTIIKLNPHITIYPVEEKMYTREEVKQIALRAWNPNAFDDENFEEWFKQNVK